MTCYVCLKPVKSVDLRTQLEAQRTMNVAVWIASPCAAHPDGIVRHSYCVPGSERWTEAMADGRTLSDRDKFWVRIFTVEK